MQFQFSKRKTNIDILFLLTLFAVFMLSALFIVLFGAKIYQKTTNQMELNYEHRTVVYYFTEKIQKNDCIHSVSVENLDNIPVIALSQDTDYGCYITYLYHYDGYLREITLSDASSFQKEDGTPIMALQELTFFQTGRLISFNMMDSEQNPLTFYVSTRCEQGGE